MTAIPLASPIVKSADALAELWEAHGWLPGLPSTVSESTFRIDQQIYRHCACHSCKGRKQTVAPYHRGNAYRLLLACPKCNRGEEV